MDNYKPQLENLEDRLVPDAMLWRPTVGQVNLNWSNANNWFDVTQQLRNVRAPSVTDSATFDTSSGDVWVDSDVTCKLVDCRTDWVGRMIFLSDGHLTIAGVNQGVGESSTFSGGTIYANGPNAIIEMSGGAHTINGSRFWRTGYNQLIYIHTESSAILTVNDGSSDFSCYFYIGLSPDLVNSPASFYISNTTANINFRNGSSIFISPEATSSLNQQVNIVSINTVGSYINYGVTTRNSSTNDQFQLVTNNRGDGQFIFSTLCRLNINPANGNAPKFVQTGAGAVLKLRSGAQLQGDTSIEGGKLNADNAGWTEMIIGYLRVTNANLWMGDFTTEYTTLAVTGNLTISNSTVSVDVNGASASQCDSIMVSGTCSINGTSPLQVYTGNSNNLLAGNHTYTFITSMVPIQGTFSNVFWMTIAWTSAQKAANGLTYYISGTV